MKSDLWRGVRLLRTVVCMCVCAVADCVWACICKNRHVYASMLLSAYILNRFTCEICSSSAFPVNHPPSTAARSVSSCPFHLT